MNEAFAGKGRVKKGDTSSPVIPRNWYLPNHVGVFFPFLSENSVVCVLAVDCTLLPFVKA